MGHTKLYLDIGAISMAFVSFLGWIPAHLSGIASTLSIIWLLMQMYDFIKKRKK